MSWLSDKVNQFLNKDSIMANNNGTTQNTNAAISAANTAASSATAATTTYNAVYNADGTTTYYYSNGSAYTVNSARYISSSTIGSTSIGAGGGGSGFVNWSYNAPTYQASIDYTGGKVTAKTFELNGADVGELIDKICDRLAIIENADPTQLEKYKSLNEAYQRYKFLENLLVDKGDKPL